ncbi:hypothetical protein QR77_38390 [Streptomyces sp. 150FB]|nr:hypothetical protein QR77_38390 [Streptomyces sp. 150FB]
MAERPPGTVARHVPLSASVPLGLADQIRRLMLFVPSDILAAAEMACARSTWSSNSDVRP